MKWPFRREAAAAAPAPEDSPLDLSLQLHDMFDRSFGSSVEDCSDLFDWPGHMTPFGGRALDQELGRTNDWQQASRFGTQVKLTVYLDELIKANPRISHLKDAAVVFVMASKELTKTMPQIGATGAVVVDALWLSFANFAVQSLFATYPSGDGEEIARRKERIGLHFAFRALLYWELLLAQPIDKSRFELIWQTWPDSWELDNARLTFIWTAIGRFLVAHELSHLELHGGDNCRLEKVTARGLIPKTWDVSEMVKSAGADMISEFIYEVEADALAMDLCDSHASAVNDEARVLVLGSIYYLFLCLRELERRVGARRYFVVRALCVRDRLSSHPLWNEAMICDIEEQFTGRAKFYFDLAAMLKKK